MLNALIHLHAATIVEAVDLEWNANHAEVVGSVSKSLLLDTRVAFSALGTEKIWHKKR